MQLGGLFWVQNWLGRDAMGAKQACNRRQSKLFEAGHAWKSGSNGILLSQLVSIGKGEGESQSRKSRASIWCAPKGCNVH